MTKTADNSQLHQLGTDLIWKGFKGMTPISLFVAVFGAAFGLAATQTGLDNWAIMLMTATVFAGASQFAALELWGTHLPVLTIAITVFAINARHLLMGATLYPWLVPMSRSRRYGVMIVASDANWALAIQMLNRGQPGFGMLFGGGLALWLFWVLGTWIGVTFGNVLSNPKALGLDMVMGCFLFAVALSGERDVRTVVIWVVAAVSSVLAYWYLPENAHVITGAVAGGLVGAFWEGKRAD